MRAEPHVPVSTHIAQNVVGGAGVATVAGVILVGVFGLPLVVMAPYALAAGLTVFGLFSITRAFGDEVTWLARVAAQAYADRRNHSEVEGLRNENRILRYELQKLQSPDAPDDASILLQAAHRLYHEHFTRGLPVSYDSCQKRRLCSRATWNAIHGLSVAARIKTDAGQVTATTFDEAWSAFCDTFATSPKRVRTINGRMVPVAPSRLLQLP